MSFDRETLRRLRDAYGDRSPGAPPGDQVPADRIWAAAAGELSAEETEALALRAAADPELARLWAMALERGAAESVDDTAAVAELLAAEADVVRPRWRMWVAASLVAAAAAALLVWIGRPPDETWRGADAPEITVSAVEASAAGTRLDWEAEPGATWSLRIFDANLDPVFRVDGLRDSEALVPPEALPEGPLTWQVHGVWTGGREARSAIFRLP